MGDNLSAKTTFVKPSTQGRLTTAHCVDDECIFSGDIQLLFISSCSYLQAISTPDYPSLHSWCGNNKSPLAELVLKCVKATIE